MTKLSCVGCGQRYYGLPSQSLRCDFCHSPVEETMWNARGRRAAMAPLPVVQPPLPAYPQTARASDLVLDRPA